MVTQVNGADGEAGQVVEQATGGSWRARGGTAGATHCACSVPSTACVRVDRLRSTIELRLGRWLNQLARLPRTVAGMDALPAVHPRPGLPSRVSVYEVGPRDGLQAEKAVVPLPVKLEFIDRLGEAGLAVIEATSFVSPRWSSAG